MASSITGFGGVASNVAPRVQPEIIVPVLQVEKIEKKIDVEEYIRNYFSDIPIMVEIARCESQFRQHDKSGKALRGEANDLDRGVMQINEFYHNDTSSKLGYDLLTIEGNTAYARALFEKQGVKPWASSSRCWTKTTAYADYKEDRELAMR